MTSLRETVRRWLGRAAPEPGEPSRFSFRVHWTKTVRGWDIERRERVHSALLDLTQGAGFEATTLDRRYLVAEVDDLPHAGASLVALLEVLEALSRPMEIPTRTPDEKRR
jgi:hypothetical protein